MTVLVAQTYAEAYLYLDLTPCECGETAFTPSVVAEADCVRWFGVCPRCGRERSFRFRFGDRPDSTGFSHREAPSELIDAGQWLWVAERYLSGVPQSIPGIRALPRDQQKTVQALLDVADAALDEAAKFWTTMEDDEDLPESALWTGWSRQARAAAPERFRRRWLSDQRSRWALLDGGIPPMTDEEFAGGPDSDYLKVVRLRAEVRAMWVARHGLSDLTDRRATPAQRLELQRAERAATGLDVATGYSTHATQSALAAYDSLVSTIQREFATDPGQRDGRLAEAAAVRAVWLAETGLPAWSPDDDVYEFPADRMPPAGQAWEMVRAARAAAGVDPDLGDIREWRP
ncbi:DNA-directed RNA polymerase subunit beta' [Actinoplanes sp. SE50]|uniref:hypothetical protein n=1 Tax=unclassified Actinoplanes TaxID=2626549 RepID=UPI00023EC400|nr:MULTISPECIES: hypothetical protein [unclassified Actinoplanes]AEV82489.1 DNA-directed RNA polymerase subunit beta' [Actinoplanes sp. SE50/110]ATO80886.1 DNA-directed RNA polymerase subunit beta' [Actinoplanes sp. SE50]SLL98293.1 DNA-directed RNA polymerase subunit beta' [Actinoplanes sp. SE50/110]